MKAKTLITTVRQVERLAKKYITTRNKLPDALHELNSLIEMTNLSPITDALSLLFVQTYKGLENYTVNFVHSPQGTFPNWTTKTCHEQNFILLNPIGLYKFRKKCKDFAKQTKKQRTEDNFCSIRLNAYMAELRKLPAHHIIFLLILNEIARHFEVTRTAKPSDDNEKDAILSKDYLNLLWAFKELEVYFLQHNGISLRSEYNIRWYETEWFRGT